MLNAIMSATPQLLSAMDTKTERCLEGKAGCQIYKHFCGTDNVWNLKNTLLFIQFSLENTQDEFLGRVSNAVTYMLSKNNLETLLSRMSTFCPNESKYCGPPTRGRRETRETFVENDVQKYLESKDEHLREKRFFDHSQIIKLFNKVICSEKMVESLAGYWDEHYVKLSYSRVWIMRVTSDFWCCLVHNLSEF